MLNQQRKNQSKVVLFKRQIFSLLILYKRKNKKYKHGESLTLHIQMGTSLHNKF